MSDKIDIALALSILNTIFIFGVIYAHIYEMSKGSKK